MRRRAAVRDATTDRGLLPTGAALARLDLQATSRYDRISEQSNRALFLRARERTVAFVLTRIRGTLQSVSDEIATLVIEPFEIEVLISEHTRRTIQTKLGESISFHTIFYIEGGSMVSRLVPARGRFSVADRPRVLRHLLLGRRRRRAQGPAGDGPPGPRNRPHDRRAGRQTARDLSRHRRSNRRANRRQAAAQGRQVRLDRRARSQARARLRPKPTAPRRAPGPT